MPDRIVNPVDYPDAEAWAEAAYGVEHPAVMMERLLQEKHNLILDNERLRQALAEMLKHFDHPKRDEWMNDAGWEQAVIACEHAHVALDRTAQVSDGD